MANTKSLDLELSSAQYVYITDNASLSITGDITIEAWIKLEQLPSTAGTEFRIVAKTTSTSVVWDKYSYDFYIDGANTLYFEFSNDGFDPGTYGHCTTAFIAEDVGVWHHVAVVVDVSVPTITFYIDGAAKTTHLVASADTSIYDSTASFYVGARGYNNAVSAYLDSLIDEVRVFNDIRSAGEIADAYNRELTAEEIADANTKGNWRLNNDLLDETANNNDLTAVNAPVFSEDVPFEEEPPPPPPSIVGWKTLLGVGQG